MICLGKARSACGTLCVAEKTPRSERSSTKLSVRRLRRSLYICGLRACADPSGNLIKWHQVRRPLVQKRLQLSLPRGLGAHGQRPVLGQAVPWVSCHALAETASPHTYRLSPCEALHFLDHFDEDQKKSFVSYASGL
ncbi:hypothetical protein CSUI_001166 [Cystoisospora suis]|uniref:Uncharacterized protein n=1 Tax=Cystoisospora suis TaxID=483139 RepID=A0A2C6KYF2_9APIC|nr:hypothetical protein CSUI_001166 [Cystoisospora suis]